MKIEHFLEPILHFNLILRAHFQSSLKHLAIKIHDKDFPIIAEIEDIRAFHVSLITEEGEMIVYPNNLLFQKGISIIKK